MAYIKTFTYQVRSNAGISYTLQFWDQGANASNWADQDGTLGKDAIKIKFGSDGAKMYAPIKASTISIDLMITDNIAGQYISEIRNNRQEQDVYVYLYTIGTGSPNATPSNRATFSGFLLMDLSDDPDISVPYNCKLKAVDGLASLKYYDFVPPHISQNPDHLYQEHETYLPSSLNTQGVYPALRKFKDWIALILEYSGYSTTAKGSSTNAEIIIACNWFNGNMPNSTGDPLNYTRAKAVPFYKKEGEEDEIKFKPMNCYEALEAICITWGMRCFNYHNRFYFISVNNFSKNESGTLANPVNIRNRKYAIDGTLISTQNYLDKYWGRYQMYLSNSVSSPTPQQKLSGGQYGVLPAFKKVSVDFLNVANTNAFVAFPLLQSPWPISNLGSSSIRYTTLGIFNFDGINDQTFYQEIWLNFVNQNTDIVDFEFGWTIEKKLVGSNDWYFYRMHWPSGVLTKEWELLTGVWPASTTTFGVGTISIPTGPSSHNICLAANGAQQASFVEMPAADFPAGDYEFRYKQAGTWISSSQTNYNHGRCDPQNQSNYNRDPDSNSITYTNSAITIGIGASMFSPVTNGAIGSLQITTNVVQTGNDTAFEEIKGVVFGDTNAQTDEAFIQVWDGSNFIASGFAGFWGVDTLAGSNSLAETLAEEVFKRQAKNVKKLNTTISLLGGTEMFLTDGTATKPGAFAPFTKLFTPTHSASSTPAAQWVMHTGEFSIVKDEWSLNLYQFETFNTGFTSTSTSTGGNNTGGVGGGTGIPTSGGGGYQALAAPTNTTTGALNNLKQSAVIPVGTITYTQAISASGNFTLTYLDVLPINDALLKTGDTIFINCQDYPTLSDVDSIYRNTLTLTLSADQAAGSTRIFVNSIVIYQNISKGDQITIDQKDLITQYQNKTKGTIAGFGIDSDGISKGGIEITGWLDSDTMEGASVNNIPTAESVKAYVDASGGRTPTLQAVTNAGASTTDALTLAGITATTGNFSGQLAIPTIPLLATSAASKDYVDTQISTINNPIFSMLTCTSTTITSATDGVANAVIMKFDNEAISSGPSSGSIVVYGSGGIEGIANSDYCWAIIRDENNIRYFENSWNVTTNTNSVNNRLLSGIRLQQGTLSGSSINWNTIVPPTSYIYDRGLGSVRKGSAAGSVIVASPASSTPVYYRMQYWKEAASNGGVKSESVLNGTQISIKQLK